MTKKHDNLAAQYTTAKARLDEADGDVRRVSRNRLAELMKLPEQQRFAHLEDSALTPQDRSTLRRGLAAQLVAAKSEIQLFRIPMIWLWGRLRYRLPAMLVTMVIASPLCVWGIMAWHNTAESHAFDQPLTLNWTLPSGEIQQTTVAAGHPIVIVHHWGMTSFVRHWIAGQGYATARVNIK
jgi:hypothetical protein